MAGVDHQPLKICVIHQGFQNLFPDSLVTPPAEPAVYVLPVPIRFWQVPPGGSHAQNPEYSVDKLPGITGIPPSCPLFPYCVWPDFLLSFVTDIVSMLFSRHFFCPPASFEDYYITLLLTTPSNVALGGIHCRLSTRFTFYIHYLPFIGYFALSRIVAPRFISLTNNAMARLCSSGRTSIIMIIS